ncbi:MAG TPA: four helix bundle protein [Rhodanobacteraceae bacterium]
MIVTHFRELNVWQHSMRLAKAVYQLTAKFPREERFGLSAQLQRAAVSIPSNIAEGNARHSRRDYARFISMASGSVAELQTQLTLARDLELTDAQSVEDCLSTCEQVSKMLYRLQQALLAGEDERSPVPGPRSRISEQSEEYL